MLPLGLIMWALLSLFFQKAAIFESHVCDSVQGPGNENGKRMMFFSALIESSSPTVRA